jgi:hypothetical protein
MDYLDWDPVDHHGRSILIRQSQGHGPTYEAKVEVEGTHVRVSGNIEREAFLDIVASLGPAPTELPPIIDR